MIFSLIMIYNIISLLFLFKMILWLDELYRFTHMNVLHIFIYAIMLCRLSSFRESARCGSWNTKRDAHSSFTLLVWCMYKRVQGTMHKPIITVRWWFRSAVESTKATECDSVCGFSKPSRAWPIREFPTPLSVAKIAISSRILRRISRTYREENSLSFSFSSSLRFSVIAISDGRPGRERRNGQDQKDTEGRGRKLPEPQIQYPAGFVSPRSG